MQLRDVDSDGVGAGSERGKYTLPISLLLLGVGYVFMVSGPLLSTRVPSYSMEGVGSAFASLPTAASAGLALLGAAAMVLVLVQLVRDVERHPYAAIAPVLAVFSAYLLASTRAKLPFAGFVNEHLGMFVLMLALLGGGLLQQRSAAARTWGWSLATLPFAGFTAALLFSLPGGPASLVRAEGPVQTYLLLLGVSAVALAVSGTIARSLVREQAVRRPPQQTPRMPTQPPGQSPQLRRTHDYVPPGNQRNLQRMQAPAAPRQRTHPGMHPSQQQSLRRTGEGPRAPLQATHAPRLNTMDEVFDADLERMMRGRRGLKPLLLGALAIALGGGGGYALFAKHGAIGASLIDDLAGKPSDAKPVPAVATPVRTEPIAPAPAAAPAPVPTTTPVVQAATTEPIAAPAAAAIEERGQTSRGESRAEARAQREERRQARSEKRRRSVNESGGKSLAGERANAKSVELETADEAKPEKVTKAAAKPEKLEAPAKPANDKLAKPEAPKPPSENERDLDLDSLINKAVRKPNDVNAADDPLLGL